MRKRGYKRNSVKSQTFREEKLSNLQSHPLRNKKVSSHSYYVAYTFYLAGAYHSGNYSIWFEERKRLLLKEGKSFIIF